MFMTYNIEHPLLKIETSLVAALFTVTQCADFTKVAFL